MRRSLFAAPVLIVAGVLISGCSPQGTTTTASESSTVRDVLPECDGAATSEYGLGDAIRSSISDLAALPSRFSTGLGTVTESNGTLAVSIRLCSADTDADQTRDAASVVSRSIARSDSLGAGVGAIRVENPNGGIRLVARPFDAAHFSSDASLLELRRQWATDTAGN